MIKLGVTPHNTNCKIMQYSSHSIFTNSDPSIKQASCQFATPSSIHALPSSFSPPQLCTFPIILYLLVKNVSQSFSTPCSFSPRSSYSGRQSSGWSDDCARAREASLPAKTDDMSDDSMLR